MKLTTHQEVYIFMLRYEVEAAVPATSKPMMVNSPAELRYSRTTGRPSSPVRQGNSPYIPLTLDHHPHDPFDFFPRLSTTEPAVGGQR